MRLCAAVLLTLLAPLLAATPESAEEMPEDAAASEARQSGDASPRGRR